MQISLGTPIPDHDYNRQHADIYARIGALYGAMKQVKTDYDPQKYYLPSTADIASYAVQDSKRTRAMAQFIAAKIAVSSSREFVGEWSDFTHDVLSRLPEESPEQAEHAQILVEETVHLFNFGNNPHRIDACLRVLEKLDTIKALDNYAVALKPELMQATLKMNRSTGKWASVLAAKLN